MNKTAITYGLLTGLAVLLSSLALIPIVGDVQDLTFETFKQAELYGSVRYLIIPLGVILAMLKFRKGAAGAVAYKSAIAVGVTTALVCGVAVGLMEAAYFAMNPEFADKMMEIYREQMATDGKSQAEIDAFMRQAEFFASPAGSGVWYFFETTLVGSVVALIAGLFVKRAG